MVKKLAQEDVHLDFWRDGYRKIATKVKQPTGFQKIVTLARRSASVLDGNCRSLETAGHCCPMSVASMTMKAQSQRLSRVISENNGLVLRKAAVEPPTITEGGGLASVQSKSGESNHTSSYQTMVTMHPTTITAMKKKG